MRHRRSVDAFERLVTTDLEPSVELDRGARRLLRQTSFLVSAFRRYESKLIALGRVDEHGLRSLLTSGLMTAFTRVVLTVPDHVVDPSGLWPADYDLLTRLPGLEQLNVVATERVLDSGYYERLVDLLPGLSEERISANRNRLPVVVAPPDGEQSHFVWRDREEELLAVVRRVKSSTKSGRGDPDQKVILDRRVGVVFRRPLRISIWRGSCSDKRVFRSRLSTLCPLLPSPMPRHSISSVRSSRYDRPSAVALLRSPHFSFEIGDRALDRASVETLDQMLRSARYPGGRAALGRLVTRWRASVRPDHAGPYERPAGAAGLVLQLAEELRPLENEAPPSILLDTLATFLTRHATRRVPQAPLREREMRARRAVWTAVDELMRAHMALDDRSSPVH